jgi:NAD(P)-dependent dehydrogenase (short-subunit alcohol dehydrogenase family)
VTLASAFAGAAEPGSAIVTIVSLDLAQAYPERATASVVSNGLVGATRAMAVEWARKPVRVNAVANGPVLADADRTAVADGLRSLDRMLVRAPSHRIGTPKETAAVVRFLVDDRSRFITGQVLYVDGGWAALTQHAEGLRFP